VSIEASHVLGAVAIGIGASLLMDLWNLFLRRAFGVAVSRTPRPPQARLKSVATHTVFGAGLYVCGLGVSCVPLVHV
jgi:hypothetical protein